MALTRRHLLGGIAGATTVAIAGCTGGSDDDGNGIGGEGESFAYDGTVTDEMMSMSIEGEVDGAGNYRTVIDADGMVTEVVALDGTSYVSDEMGGCHEGDAGEAVPVPMTDPTQWDADPDVESDGTETVDGEEMDVYIDESDTHDETAKMFIDSDNRLRRVEVDYGDGGDMEMNIHSHGESFDIQVPDGC